MQTLLNVAPQSAVKLPYHLMAEMSSGDAVPGQMNDPVTAGAVRPKVLVADDSLTERANLARIIQAAGYEVVLACSGNEAVELALQHQPVAIFLDIIMEDGDGYKACRSLRRQPATADVPVIMVSSKANAVDQKWAEKLGASNYVVKPYNDDVILQALAGI